MSLTVTDTSAVLVVGGGTAAIEAVLALRELAGDRVVVTVLAPEGDFVSRPAAVLEPFAGGSADHFALDGLVSDAGATLVAGALARVDVAARQVHTVDGEVLDYDELILALGATASERFPLAVTIDPLRLDAQAHGIIQDIEGGYVHTLAFVVPERIGWPLPIYELALMAAERAYDANARLDVTVITPELAPLAVFGAQASAAVAELLRAAGITVLCDVRAEVPAQGRVALGPGGPTVVADHVMALPELVGPAIAGLPSGDHGFLAVDALGRVHGADHVHAAGDATDGPIKHGGLAAQQAETVARDIAASLGAPMASAPAPGRLHGELLTGRKPLYLSVDGDGSRSSASHTKPWSAPGKVDARRLAPFLELHEPAVVRAGR